MEQVLKIGKKKLGIILFICWIPSIVSPIIHPLTME
jgi:hypothetical protein